MIDEQASLRFSQNSGPVSLFNETGQLHSLSGYLEKRGRWNRAWKRRFFELDTSLGTIRYFKPDRTKPSGSIHLTSKNFDVLDLEPGDADASKGNPACVFRVRSKRRTFVLRAEDINHAIRWKAALEEARCQVHSEVGPVSSPVRVPSPSQHTFRRPFPLQVPLGHEEVTPRSLSAHTPPLVPRWRALTHSQPSSPQPRGRSNSHLNPLAPCFIPCSPSPSPTVKPLSGSFRPGSDVLGAWNEGEAKAQEDVGRTLRLNKGRQWHEQLRVAELQARFAGGVYSKLAHVNSPFTRKIRKDIARTFPSHPFFVVEENKQALFRVMKAYSAYDPSTGYTQGMCFVAGFLLLHMREEEAFWAMVRLLYGEHFNLRLVFRKEVDVLRESLLLVDRLLARTCPALCAHLTQMGIDSSMFATQWFLTLFIYRCPIPTTAFIWDRLILDGVRALFEVAVAVLQQHEWTLLQLPFEEAIPYLNHKMVATPATVALSRKVRLKAAELRLIFSIYGAKPTTKLRHRTPKRFEGFDSR